MSSQQRLRTSDFDMRTKVDPDVVYRDPLLGAYIAIHPMADETELLQRLHLSPDACMKVDCYWKYDDDVYFVQIESSKYARRSTGLWGRLLPGDPGYVNLVGVVSEEFVTRPTVHRVLDLFRRLPLRNLQLEDSLRCLSATSE